MYSSLSHNLSISFITHFKIAKTDPGIINYYNNIDMLEFYYFLYHEIIELKEEYNLKYNVNINLYKEKNNYSSDEEENMECKSIISDKMKKIISTSNKSILLAQGKRFPIPFYNMDSQYLVLHEH